MNKFVSIWIANTNWEDSTLREVLKPSYSEDGDFLGSEFTNAFALGYIDDDKIEAETIELTTSFADAIDGFSYDTDILNDMKIKKILSNDTPIDTIVLIYDYEFNASTDAEAIRDKYFLYIGKFEYRE
ncbi:immunity 22 family protein [Pseudomonas sp. NPDC089530]|uniref:immunity 22 family protein n=1 Tax=Pseudomonas sp. NPDC089530 TaxID=3390651 RepID=UPI003D04A311